MCLRGHIADDLRSEDSGNGGSSDQNTRLQSFDDLPLKNMNVGIQMR